VWDGNSFYVLMAQPLFLIFFTHSGRSRLVVLTVPAKISRRSQRIEWAEVYLSG